MSEKAILVIDKPIDCFECPLFLDDPEYRCQVTQNLYEDCNSTTCPLKPLPRLENNDDVDRMMCKHSAFIHMTMNKHAMMRFIDGWESCLDEIEGKGR